MAKWNGTYTCCTCWTRANEHTEEQPLDEPDKSTVDEPPIREAKLLRKEGTKSSMADQRAKSLSIVIPLTYIPLQRPETTALVPTHHVQSLQKSHSEPVTGSGKLEEGFYN